MGDNRVTKNQRLSLSAKNAKDKQWYKDQADALDNEHGNLSRSTTGNISDYKRMKVNYDLFNNVLNLEDFSYVCQPFGSEAGELQAKMVNRDIVSGKIKALLGMEMKRPFPWKALATNSEATTRKEQKKLEMLKEYVQSAIMTPIKQQIEMKYQEQAQGKPLSPDQQEKIQKQIAEETKAMTPPEVLRYMEREHQDPAEVLSNQLLNYLIQKTDAKRKFNTGFKHMHLSAKEIFYVGVLNGEPEMWNVNSMRFNTKSTADNELIEDGESASCEYRMTPSDVVKYFGDELSDKEIDEVYERHHSYGDNRIRDGLFTQSSDYKHLDADDGTVRVLHCVWKSLRKIGFLTYLDEDGDEQQTIVFEGYKRDVENGDIRIEWEWIPEVYETWKIGYDKYAKMQPIPGQFKDLDNLYHCKLPYYGAYCDNMNASPKSIMDRLKVYQYYYNIVMYRIELLIASDKGKKVMMNIKNIPDSAGMDMKKWQYFFESSPFMWYDDSEEGNSIGDQTLGKTIDLSLASDIGRYVDLANYLKQQAGQSVGITEQVEGQIDSNDAVSNTRQNLVQTSNILEPFFDLHNVVKRNVLQALLETAKVAYSESAPEKLSYFLDDMSLQMFDMDMELLDNSTLGIFMSNTTETGKIMENIEQLTHAAMQNGKAELSDVLSVLRQDGIVEAEEVLKAAETKRRQQEQAEAQQRIQAEKEAAEKARQHQEKQWQHDKDLIILKEEERRKTEIQKSAIVAAGFNPDTDADNDGINDFLEIARDGLHADIKREEIALNREKLNHDKIIDTKKLELEEKKINKESNKAKKQ